MIRPTATLTFTLFGPDATQENVSALKRGYSYIAPVSAKAQRPAEDEEFDPENVPVENVMRMTVRLPKNPYWISAVEGGDESWSEILLPWVAMTLKTLFETVHEYNNPTRASHVKALVWKTLELAMENQLIAVAIEPDNSLRDIVSVLENVRSYLNSEGVDPAAISTISVPSNAARGESDWLEITLADGTTNRVDL